jgi:hypothetical protein
MANNEFTFHITQVPPNKMLKLDKDTYINEEIPQVKISSEQSQLLDDLNNKQVLLPDSYVRKKHEYNPENGGVAILHIKHPYNYSWRATIHPNTYLCSDLVEAMKKYRTAEDRREWYGSGPYAKVCYLYLFDPTDAKRSGFEQINTLCCEFLGSSLLPAQYVGCYRITWNGN